MPRSSGGGARTVSYTHLDVYKRQDWWIAIILSATTGIAIVEDRLVKYRLHDLNTVEMCIRDRC